MRSSSRPRGYALAVAALLGLSGLTRAVGSQPGPLPASPLPAPPAAVTAGSTSAPAKAAAPRRTIDPAGVVEAVQKLTADVQRWGGSAGAIVVDIPSGEVLASLNAHTPFNPASNAKLITAAAALRTL